MELFVYLLFFFLHFDKSKRLQNLSVSNLESINISEELGDNFFCSLV